MEIYTGTYTATSSTATGNIPINPSAPLPLSQNTIISNRVQGDKVTISSEGKEKSQRFTLSPNKIDSPTDKSLNSIDQQELSQLQKLKRRDTEVRTHEHAHLSAAGPYAKGSASFTFQKGADGKSYAVGGEISIDVSKESTPEETISKMQTIKRAALAPANPSGADRRIASQATIKESEARKEILANQQGEMLHRVLKENSLEKNQSDDEDVNFTPVSTSGTLTSKLATYAKMAA